MKQIVITVSDLMQQGYEYKLTSPEGTAFDPRFEPQLTPKEMLELGVFGGKYMTDCVNEFPHDWFEHARLSPAGYDTSCNFFGVRASQSLHVWRSKGWIHPDDPRGWFQWYCRYYRGRRMIDDERQIRRWAAMKRHITQLTHACARGDWSCRPVQRQALLHWAYDSRKL